MKLGGGEWDGAGRVSVRNKIHLYLISKNF